jgi:Fe-S oxidoreductase
VSARSIDRLSAYGPRTVVFWCPSCNVHYDDVVLGRDGGSVLFEIIHCTTFLAARARRGELGWKREVDRRVALHAHVGREGHETGRRRAREDRESCAALLRSIPGVELVGIVEAPPEYDYDCGPSPVDLDRSRWLEIREELLERARGLGADTVATISHACQREWCDAGEQTLQVRNYVSLLADALGIERDYPVDALGDYKRLADPDAIVDSGRAAWSSHGLSEQQARAIAAGYTWQANSPRITAP